PEHLFVCSPLSFSFHKTLVGGLAVFMSFPHRVNAPRKTNTTENLWHEGKNMKHDEREE
ncbi:hypothetical protein STEG23_032753, partial [Scotinomys teguina]